jgi:hypothetical protein
MKTKVERYKSADEFGKSLGLSKLGMELSRQKKRIIEKLRKSARAPGPLSGRACSYGC